MITIFILACIFSILVFFYYKKTNPPISNSMKWFLGMLRFLFFFIVLILLISPILHINKVTKKDSITIFAIDDSKSMSQNLNCEKSKKVIMQEWILKLSKFFESNKIDFKTYQFSNGLENDTNRTDIFLSLNQISKKEKNSNSSDIILFSDGLNHNNNNFSLLEEINIPVSVLQLEENIQSPDLSIEDVITNNPVYLNSKTEIKILLENFKKNQKIIVNLLEKDKLISQQKFSNIDNKNEIILDYKPQEIGFKKLQISVEFEDLVEDNLKNNRREFLLNVAKNRANIVILTSNLNWDISFVHRALLKNKKFKLHLLEKRKDGYYSNNKIVDISDFILQTDLLILHNKNNFNLSNGEYNNIKKFVKRGGNVIYFGKIDDKISDILPLEKSKYPDEIIADISFTNLTKDYQSFAFGKTDDATQKICENLPPITAYFYDKKKGAEILAIANLQTKNPIIAFSKHFNGNVLMFAVDGFYRWKMWENSQNEWFDKFFNSIANWLINTDIKKRFFCTTDKLQYMRGEAVEFSALLFDEKMNSIPKQNILLKISYQDSLIEKYFIEKDDKYKIAVSGLREGKYNFQVETILGNHTLISKGEFLIESMPLEDSSTGINSSFLKFISSQTDGKIIRSEKDFEQLLEIKRKPKEIKRTKEIELWRKWYVPVVAILLLSLELFIRRRKGLL